ncbi:MAG: CotH kinase family protein [Acidobacteriota bacterium]
MKISTVGRSVVAAGIFIAGLAQMSPTDAAPQGPGAGGVQTSTKLLAQFDKDGDKRLNAAERRAALAFMATQGGGRGRGGFGGGRGAPAAAAAESGPKVARSAVKSFPSSISFYDLGTLRTLFLDFEDTAWEDELTAFKDTDVEVPATLQVDGKTYKEVGIQFRGASSFFTVAEGLKHSLDVSVDFANKDQQIGGYRSLNLLNSHEDPTFLRSVLYLQAARDYLPAARANFVRVVINGESWGIYANVQQVNKDFLREWFKTEDGTRWKVPGTPNGRGGLEYIGDNANAYKQLYEIKTKDNQKSWDALVNLTRVLNQTPADKLEAALDPILDIDKTLRFLAIDNVLVNNDGYWTRASDYNIYLDPNGKFHVLPHDTNETFGPAGGRGGGPGGFGPPPGAAFGGRPGGPGRPQGPGGPLGPAGQGRGGPGGGRGGRGGPGGGMMAGTATLDLLIGLDDTTKPLRSKLLAVPALRAKYLMYAQQIATKWLDWKTLGPLVTQYQALIEADVKADTRKLNSNEEFDSGAATLKTFADTRRAVVLNYKVQ